MKIAIASGKGGTGKTTVTASLLSVWESSAVAVDLDVEEPNLHLFLTPAITKPSRPPWKSPWWMKRCAPIAGNVRICASLKPSAFSERWS